MKDRSQFFYTLAKAADLQDEVIPGQPLVEIVGNNRVLIEHHQGVSEYSLCRICVRVKNGGIVICGEALSLTKMTNEQLVIHGCIHAVELLRGKC